MDNSDARHDGGFAGTYRLQAATYDRSRSAGRETLAPLLEALATAPGRRVLDVGGGTGNYAVALTEAGFDGAVIDRSADMLSVAAAKGLAVTEADATALPIDDASTDAVTMLAVLHQIPRWRLALSEAQRVLRPGGVLVLVLYTREHMNSHFFLDYFPSSRAWAGLDMKPIAEYLAALPGARAVPLQIRATDDLTMQAMRRHPWLALDPRLTSQTSFFVRLADEDPDGLRRGMEQLAADVSSGTIPYDHDADLPDGDAYLVWWTKPAVATV